MLSKKSKLGRIKMPDARKGSLEDALMAGASDEDDDSGSGMDPDSDSQDQDPDMSGAGDDQDNPDSDLDSDQESDDHGDMEDEDSHSDHLDGTSDEDLIAEIRKRGLLAKLMGPKSGPGDQDPSMAGGDSEDDGYGMSDSGDQSMYK